MESIGFSCKKNISNFHILGLFIPKNDFGAKKKFHLSRGVAGVAGVAVRSLV
jgi:hypothetical protein